MSDKASNSGQESVTPPRPAIAFGGAQSRSPNPAVYLSWGGQIYGPSSREEVMAGIRTSWFEEDALYWHEGLDDWRPVGEFPVSPTNDCRHVQPGELPAAPSLPASPRGAHGPLSRERRPRSSKPASRRLGSRGRAIFLVFALLAVLLTVGALLLLMLI